jgi:hypothetical protein
MTGEYEEWQSLLSDAFLLPHDGPTVLFLDDSEISRLLPGAEDASRHLGEAVRSRVRLSEGRSMFSSLTAAYRQWQRGSQSEPPPVLPVVAITVLAATRMRSDSEARSTNYYLRLAQALLPDATRGETETLRNDLREGGAFLDAVEMWRGLHSWLEAQDGTVGVSTIRDHPHLQRIGYPLSQALVRQSDRLALTRFFQALDFHPGPAPGAEVILGALDIWTAALQNRLSDAFMRALSDTDIRPLLSAVVEAHAQAWDGRVLTIDGKQRIAVRLSIDLDAWRACWLFPVPPGGPEVLTVLAADGQEVELTATTGLAHYAARGRPAVSPELLLSGMRLRGREFTAEFPPSPVLFLLPDPQTGTWSSVPGMLPFEEHLVAISGAHVGEFQQVLGEAASAGWRLIPQRGSVLLSSYALFQNVRFTDGQALEHTLSRLPGLRRIGVTPAVIPRARLVRGLPIATTISATHYLVGGEPDLLLPSGPDPRPATVTLDGRRERLQANGFPLELRRFVSGTGRHIVDADGQELAFTTLEEGPDPGQPAGTATLGWTSGAHMSGFGQALAVIGALVSSTTDITPVLARRSRDESWLLHHDGRTERITEPAPPSFLSSIDIDIRSPSFEIRAPASARWLAQRRGARWHLTEIGPADPSEHTLAIDVLDAWKRACSDTNGAQLWKVQLSMSASSA